MFCIFTIFLFLLTSIDRLNSLHRDKVMKHHICFQNQNRKWFLTISKNTLSFIIRQLYINITIVHYDFTLTLEDFNAKLTIWFRSDKSAYEGLKIDGLVSNHSLQQLIN